MSSKIIRIIIFFILAMIILMLPSFFSPKDAPAAVEETMTPAITAIATPVVTLAPTPTPTASPSPTPSPTPTPEIPGVNVLEYYRNELPSDLAVNILYDNYEIHMDYIVALGYVRIREKPDKDSERLKTIKFGNRVKLLEKVQSDDGESIWYRVSYTRRGKEIIGFVAESRYTRVRSFAVDKMLSHVKSLHEALDGKDVVYIANFRNKNGWPQRLPNRASTDEYGYTRQQATAGYLYPGAGATFRYIPDGMLAVRLYEGYAYTKVYIPTFDYTCWVKNRNISSEEPEIEQLKQVIVVDRTRQNCGIFQHNGKAWELISLSFVTTGKPGEFSLVTPLGDFMAIERKTKFSYTADGTDEIVGYAPYVIRFSGGGYVHGVPMSYPNPNNRKIFDLDGREALSSLGTIPKSHMCVRNYTSHAKFLYKWIDIGSAAIIIIE